MKKLLIFGSIGLMVLAFGFMYLAQEDNSQNIETQNIETDYKALVDLGQAPNSPARPPEEGDIDTGISGYYQGVPVKLYASRTWSNNDYGKTFIWSID